MCSSPMMRDKELPELAYHCVSNTSQDLAKTACWCSGRTFRLKATDVFTASPVYLRWTDLAGRLLVTRRDRCENTKLCLDSTSSFLMSGLNPVKDGTLRWTEVVLDVSLRAGVQIWLA